MISTYRAVVHLLAAAVVLTPLAPASAQTPTAPTIGVARPVIVLGEQGVVSVEGEAGSRVTLYAYTRPSTAYRVVRRGTLDAEGARSWAVTPAANTRLYAVTAPAGSAPGTSLRTTRTVTLDVAHSVSIGVREDAGTYRFSGVVRPGSTGLPVTLYRTLPGGGATVAGSTRTRPDGSWRVDRRFTGSGTFGFYAVTGATPDNDAGRSRGYGLTVRAARNGISLSALAQEAVSQWRQAYGTRATAVLCASLTGGPVTTLPVGAVFRCRVDGPPPFFTEGFGRVTSRPPFFTFTLLTD